MPYRPHGKAEVDPYSPRAFAVCQRCGALYNSFKLNWQFQWMGAKLQNKWVQCCPDCMDDPSIFLRQIILPPDPQSIYQPRTEPYAIDEAGGRDMPIFLSGAVALASIVSPSWAKGFYCATIGGGAGGLNLNGSYPNMGGGGGAYAQTNAVPLTGGATVYYSVGAGGLTGNGGVDSWVSITNVAPISIAQGCLAKAGNIGWGPPLFTPFGGPGGLASACIGDIAYSGGNGGTALVFPNSAGGTGGGGAAGPYGPGANAPDVTSGNNGGSGGSSDGPWGVGTGGQGSPGSALAVAYLSEPGYPGRADGAFAQSGGAGGGGGGGGGGPSVANGAVGGPGGGYGGGGGGGGYATGVNGVGGSGAPGFAVIRWLQ